MTVVDPLEAPVWLGKSKPYSEYYVYFIQSSCQERRIKIGKAKNARARLTELQTSSPYKLEVIAHARETKRINESTLHRYLAPFRICGEWFHSAPQVLNVARLMRVDYRNLEILMSPFTERHADELSWARADAKQMRALVRRSLTAHEKLLKLCDEFSQIEDSLRTWIGDEE